MTLWEKHGYMAIATPKKRDRRRHHARTVASERQTILVTLARMADEPAKVMQEARTSVRLRSAPAHGGEIGFEPLQDIIQPERPA